MYKNKEYFYCYSPRLFEFLKIEKKIPYVCRGIHSNTKMKFWQFKQSQELSDALTEFKRNGIEMGFVKNPV